MPDQATPPTDALHPDPVAAAARAARVAPRPVPPLPVPTLRRLPRYLRLLRAWEAEGRETASCTHLAAVLGLDPTLIRKDLALTGAEGRPKSGYRLAELVPVIEEFLGWNHPNEAFVIGAGNLGLALLHYQGFASYGLSVVAAFDSDPRRVGPTVLGRRVFPMAKLADLVQRMHVGLAILCVPEGAAAPAADQAYAAGIRGLWNFTGARLHLPEDATVEDIDLAQSLALLSHRLGAAPATSP